MAVMSNELRAGFTRDLRELQGIDDNAFYYVKSWIASNVMNEHPQMTFITLDQIAELLSDCAEIMPPKMIRVLLDAYIVNVEEVAYERGQDNVRESSYMSGVYGEPQ
jgi:hypothetical protein